MVTTVAECATVKRAGKEPNVTYQQMNARCQAATIMAVVLMVIVIVNVDGRDSFVINVSKMFNHCLQLLLLDFFFVFFFFCFLIAVVDNTYTLCVARFYQIIWLCRLLLDAAPVTIVHNIAISFFIYIKSMRREHAKRSVTTVIYVYGLILTLAHVIHEMKVELPGGQAEQATWWQPSDVWLLLQHQARNTAFFFFRFSFINVWDVSQFIVFNARAAALLPLLLFMGRHW